MVKGEALPPPARWRRAREVEDTLGHVIQWISTKGSLRGEAPHKLQEGAGLGPPPSTPEALAGG